MAVLPPGGTEHNGVRRGLSGPRAGRTVRVERERGDLGWLVICGPYGWLHGDKHAALEDAISVASGFGTLPTIDGGRA